MYTSRPPRRNTNAASRPYFQGNNRRKPQQRRKESDIHSSRFINKAVAPVDDVAYVPTHSFHDFGLNPHIVSTLDHIGYKAPSPIQDQTIEPGLAGRDIIGLANTGTGKTAAFLLPIINKLAVTREVQSVIVLAPTRELAQQINDEFRRFSAGQKLYSALIVGGANIGRQIKEVQRGPHLIVGTPGRVNDLIDRGVLRLANCTTFVLDEADRMCDMGFVRDIRKIESELPRTRQTFCFSATMTPDVKTIVEEFMHDPITVSVVKNETNDHIEQDVVRARDKAHKVDLLLELLAKEEFEKTIVFCETKHFAQRLSDRLNKDGFSSEAIHGNKSQSQRDRALRAFKSGTVSILVATDVAARGLDIPNVSHVINFDAPKQYDDYVHRIGRTGRAGKSGTALTFVTEQGMRAPKSPTARHHERPSRQAHDARAQRPEQSSNDKKRPSKRRMSMGAVAEDRLVNLIDSL